MSDNKGWICLHRSLLDHDLWKRRPFSKGQAWVDILLQVNHEDRKILLGNEHIMVEKGSFITSEVKLMERWGWSKSKVRAYLKTLQNDHMIVKKTDRKKTTIFVENWGKFQSQQTTEEPEKDHKKTAKEPQKDTNNKEEQLKQLEQKKIEPVRHKYGSYKNVILSDEDLEKLKSEFPSDWAQRIENLSEGMAIHGYKYRNHLAVIRRWSKTERKPARKEVANSEQRKEYAVSESIFE